MLFDEVTSALDPELVNEVLAVLRDLATHSSMTMLLVTHEMRFAEEIADRVVMFDAGRIVEDRPPHEMFSEPREARTQEFLAAVLGDRVLNPDEEARPPDDGPARPEVGSVGR
jgi:polar amino acid transport system ATP-binding protein